MNIGFVGCGSIATYHANVLKDLGHHLRAVTYKSNTERAEKFAKEHGIANLYVGSDWKRMVQNEKLDALWVIPSWDQIDLMFQEIIDVGIPAFFEKPIALDSTKIDNVIDKYSISHLSNYQVGYNRRFYDISRYLKKKLKTENILFVSVDIPEPVDLNDRKRLEYVVFENSSHVLDLLSFVLGSYDFRNISTRRLDRLRAGGDYLATYNISSIPIFIKSIWNSPENFSISVYTETDRIYRLCPLERLSVIKGFDIKEPTLERPIRSYEPKTVFSNYVTHDGFKPGFKDQASWFFERIANQESLPDNYFEELKHLTRLCEQLSFG